MSIASHPDPQLLRRAAHLRARGHDWDVIAAALGAPAQLLERMSLSAPEVWAEHLNEGLAAAQAEAFGVCLRMLVDQMQSPDGKSARAAGELLVKLHTANLRHRPKERGAELVSDSQIEPPPAARLPAESSPVGTRNASDGVAHPVARAPGSSTTSPGQCVPGSNTPLPSREQSVSMKTFHKNTLTAFLKPSG